MVSSSVRERPSRSVTSPKTMPPVAQPTSRPAVIAPVGGAERGEGGVQVGDPEGEVREPVLVHRPRARGRGRRAREGEQLDAHAVAREVYRVQINAPEPEQRVARLSRDAQLVLVAEAPAGAGEVEGALPVPDTEADVGGAPG